MITDIPVQRPDFSDIEKDFFDGDKEAEIEILEVSDDDEYQLINHQKVTLSSEQKN